MNIAIRPAQAITAKNHGLHPFDERRGSDAPDRSFIPIASGAIGAAHVCRFGSPLVHGVEVVSAPTAARISATHILWNPG